TSFECIDRPGMLPHQHLKVAIEQGYIRSEGPVPDACIQPASVDLRLGKTAYRLRSTFVPHPTRSVESLIDALAEHSINLDLANGAILENNHFYLLPLQESLDLPAWLRGRASPKSSIGRLDVFVRIVAERTTRFDDIPIGYKGPLYALVGPRSFAIVVRPNAC